MDNTILWTGTIEEAASRLRQGEVIAMPTETVYGLAADATNEHAIQRVFVAKGRPSDNPLIVHVNSIEQATQLSTSITPLELKLMEQFWPGALTFVLPLREGAVAQSVHAGLNTVAVRWPAHPIAQQLITAAGVPLAAPSANRSGRPSPTTAVHVLEDLYGHIAGVVDGGPCEGGLESTVIEVDHKTSSIHILRPGLVTAEQLAAYGTVVRDIDEAQLLASSAPKSPGTKYRHYAPSGKLTLVQGEDAAAVAGTIAKMIDLRARSGMKVRGIIFEEHRTDYEADLSKSIIVMGSLNQLEHAAQRLYEVLRQCDADGIEYLYAETCRAEGIGAAYMNRLTKAAEGTIIHV